jgi:putative phosphoesterase
MKIGVISDTHGDRRCIERAVSMVGIVDLWLHAGDHSQDSRKLAELTGLPVISVVGNCDGRTEAKPDEFIEFEGCRIWLTHGHRYHVREGQADLLFWARHYEVQAVIYGHTHIPEVFWDQDLLLFNPGSASHPRGGFPASCGLITLLSLKLISAEIIEL